MVGEKFYVIRIYNRSFYRSIVGNLYDVSFAVKSWQTLKYQIETAVAKENATAVIFKYSVIT